jgi:hypothetical protein
LANENGKRIEPEKKRINKEPGQEEKEEKPG